MKSSSSKLNKRVVDGKTLPLKEAINSVSLCDVNATLKEPFQWMKSAILTSNMQWTDIILQHQDQLIIKNKLSFTTIPPAKLRSSPFIADKALNHWMPSFSVWNLFATAKCTAEYEG